MPHEQNGATNEPTQDADFAQTFKELQRGEQTATALESHLDSVERKIEELLAQAEKAEQEMKSRPSSASKEPPQDKGKTAE